MRLNVANQTAAALLLGGLATLSAPAFAADGYNGYKLYTTHCAGCHGTNPALGLNGIKKGTAAYVISNAILFNKGGMGYLKNVPELTSAAMDDLALYIANPAAATTDSTAPTVPTGLAANGSGTQVDLSWTASTDAFGVTAYQVFRDGNLVTTLGNITSFSDTGLTAGASYSYTVTACDAANNCSAQSSAVTAAAATSYQNLWWNASENGWGMSITHHIQPNNTIFAAVYTYDASGQPEWYVLTNCKVTGNSCTDTLYKVTGCDAATATPWACADIGSKLTNSGTATLTFSDASNATFAYTLNGVQGSKAITRQVFATGTTKPAIDYTDLWWNPNESGWGVAVIQQYGMIFAAWYTYDSAGKGVWYVASACPVSGTGCTGDLYRVVGGSPLTSNWTAIDFAKNLSTAGSVTFNFSDANNGTMSYTLNGVQGSKTITRQSF